MEKLLPQNIEAECGVLGSIIIDPEAIVQVADFLHPEDFYRDAHRTIYEVIMQLYEQHEPADFITICDELERIDKLEQVGGAGYITSLINQVPTSGNVEYYGRIVERTAILRRLIHAAGEIAATAYEEEDADAALEKAEQLIFGIGQRHTHADFSALRDILSDYMEKLDQLHERRGTIVGVPTGFTDLDRLTGGLQRSDLVILAARPAVGKCLPAWTWIDHPHTGERLTIEEYVHRRITVVHSLSNQGTIQVSQVTDWVDSGIQPCYSIRTRSGRTVAVTYHHPFLTAQGWTPLYDIQPGDCIAVPARVACFGEDESWPLDKVRVLAYVLAAGKQPASCPVFTHTDAVIVRDFAQSLTAHFPGVHIQQDGQTCTVQHISIGETVAGRVGVLTPHPVMTWLTDLGVMGQREQERCFPACVWCWSKRHLAEFLRAVVSCLANSNTSGIDQNQPDITFDVSSQQLAADICHALLRFGIVAHYQQIRHYAWRVGIPDVKHRRRYQDQIGWIGEKSASNQHFTRDPEGWVQSSTQGTIDSDINWDEIVAIEPIGEHHVYDLTVPDGANFIAQDVFVHNTSLALSLAHNAAIKHNQAIAIFSLEMSKEQLVQRFLSMDAGIDQQRLRTGWIEDDEWERIIQAMGTLSEASIWIDDTAGISTVEMRSKARRLQAEHGIDLIIVDYLQLMQSAVGGKRNENRVQEISEISRNLKGLARELDVPVLALAQLSRAVESRQSKVPQLSDLRESGSIEQDADIVMFIYRDDVYNPESERKNIADIIVAKHRNGPVGEVSLYFQANQTRFRDLEVTPPTE